MFIDQTATPAMTIPADNTKLINNLVYLFFIGEQLIQGKIIKTYACQEKSLLLTTDHHNFQIINWL